MKGTEQFKAVIQAYIDEQVATDELFAKEVAKENKNIDDCIKYILSEVKKSGCCGFDNDEIWSMVHHYYTENEVEINEVGNCHIVSNHHEHHYFTFKSPSIKSFGLQSFYIGTDGEVYTSDIVTYVPDSDALDSMNAAKEVKAVEFYNIQGQRIAVPTDGFYIMGTICTDGTSTVRKVSR